MTQVSMKRSRAFVAVIEDDESVRESLPDLLGELGFDARTYDSAVAFLATDAIAHSDILILDIAMPGMSGQELQQELLHRGVDIPIIFITALIDDALHAALLQRGAVDCLHKPFADRDLREALERALARRPAKMSPVHQVSTEMSP